MQNSFKSFTYIFFLGVHCSLTFIFAVLIFFLSLPWKPAPTIWTDPRSRSASLRTKASLMKEKLQIPKFVVWAVEYICTY